MNLLTPSLLALAWATEARTMERTPDLIHRDGVGEILLGKPIPGTLLPADARDRYLAGFHADAQPHEGFRLDAPAVTVFLAEGPFGRQARRQVPDPTAPALARRAVRAARQGAPVVMMSIESSGPRTAEGLGVGSDLTALTTARPGLGLSPVPPTFGADECVAVDPSQPDVHFHFRTCEAARAGEGVLRILIFREE